MPWVAGARLGSYEILAPLGAGGMGEVYRARDTKLRREVAVKVLPDQMAADPDRMMRFQREAEVLASLNNPNIAQIYGIEERAIIMELIEGATLADRIAHGPLQIDEALTVARQIADALEAAHDKGITHRDLKPTNIMVTRDGAVKVLDFGLAAIPIRDANGSADRHDSPTMTIAATQAGMIMGTAAYMSPEQAAGKPVDKRADIWSFGVVFWEMLTGQQLFSGETVADTLADVLRAPIDLDKLPKETPLAVRELLRRCLSRDLKKRLRDIGDLPLLLDQYSQRQPMRRPVVPPLVSWIIAAAAFVAALVSAAIHFREAPAAKPMPATFQFEPPGSVYTIVSVSPDGRYIAMSSRTSRVPLVIRPVDELQIQQLPGTEGAQFPFWSPDSAYIGFTADGKLKKIALGGGAAQTLCDGGGRASWGRDGYIVFGGGTLGKIQRVPATGGVPSAVMTVSSGGNTRIDQVLPDGRHFLYSLIGDKTENNGIYVGSSDGSPSVRLVNDLSNAIYVPGKSSDRGYLLFQRDKRLMAAPFDAHALKIDGDMLPVAEQVDGAGFLYDFAFSASESGMLAYRSATNGGSIRRELEWVDLTGKRLGAASKPEPIGYFGMSADGARAAFQYLEGDHADLWLADVNRGSTSRFTFMEGFTYTPVWSPDGGRIAFGFYDPKKQAWGLYLKATSGTAEQQLLTPTQGINASVYDWSRDGRFIVYSQQLAETKTDLWLLALDGDRKPVPYLRTSANEIDAQFSPDGRWMAYASDESGQYQVYIQGVPAGTAKWQVSASGGTQPRWSHDGKELFYISGDNMLTSASVRSGVSIEVSDPMTLFRMDSLGPKVYAYAPAPDGRRFLVNLDAAGPVPPVTVVLDWRALLKR